MDYSHLFATNELLELVMGRFLISLILMLILAKSILNSDSPLDSPITELL